MNRVLIAGLARSGTTWIGEALSGAERAVFVDEPDNHYRSPFAFRAKRELPGRAYPRLGPDDTAPEYEALWKAAFGVDLPPEARAARTEARRNLARAVHLGVLPRRLRRGPALVRRSYLEGGRAPARLAAAAKLALPEIPPADGEDVIVKSVYAARSLEWLTARLPARVLILKRDLRGVLASWKAEGWLSDPCEDAFEELGPGGERALAMEAGASGSSPPRTRIGRVGWLLACLAGELRDAAARHPDWTVASYEELCGDAGRLVPELAAELGVGWSAAADAALSGPLAPPPRPRGVDPRLSEAEAGEIASVLSQFDLRGWAW